MAGLCEGGNEPVGSLKPFMMMQVYGDDNLGRSAAFQWYQRLSQGKDSLEDDERTGRPQTIRTERKIE
ncbi:hypothetical protein ANN_22569 [Periplaneta americana]|uniref:Per a allergen n=1 Tax=Periplaneta americana TaxID=6978 RepID=A0ABQ8S8R4_PERAM|nr:hypothetical protein ANN_22569 [Periplaneta americana]